MAASLLAYQIATGCAEPLLGAYLRRRIAQGKERPERTPERFGRPSAQRPDGPLLWMHGASVGETGLLIDLFKALREERPLISGLITSQTLTSADRIAAMNVAGLTHQMAPADGPRAVRRFLDYWRPDAGVFAEGEIWPNLLRAAHRREIPLILANARMTEKSRTQWRKRRDAAATLFGAFDFIGAADLATAKAVANIRGAPADAVGNLKRAAQAPDCDPDQLSAWRAALKNRRVLLAASTHDGEEALALEAFAALPPETPDALLILAPRHPDRGAAIEAALAKSGIAYTRRSKDPAPIGDARVLLADTIGEMGLWLRLADSVYLGGGHASNVGGHNPIEPLRLKKPVFTGPETFNFVDLFDRLAPTRAVRVGDNAHAFVEFWTLTAHDIDWPGVEAVFAEADGPLTATLNAIETALSSEGRRHA